MGSTNAGKYLNNIQIKNFFKYCFDQGIVHMYVENNCCSTIPTFNLKGDLSDGHFSIDIF